MDMIYFKILKASELIRDSFDIETSIGLKLSSTESLVMYAIGQNISCTQTEIVSWTNIHKVAISRACIKLEQLNLVAREPHLTDFRMYLLSLTVDGKAASTRLSAALQEWESRLTKALGKDSASKIDAIVAELETIGLSAARHGPHASPATHSPRVNFLGE